MNENRYDMLLRQIAAGQSRNPQDRDIERAYERLDDYIQRELAGTPASEQLPDVAFFIATDEGFAEIYRALRRHAASFAPDTKDVSEGTFDMQALVAFVDGQIIIAPEDIARPLAPQPTPAKEEQAYLRMVLPYWQRQLPTRGGVFMSGDDEALKPVELPDQEQPTRLDLVLSHEDGGVAIDGRVSPDRPDLIGCPVRLYRADLQPEPALTVVVEEQIDRFGRFELADISPGRYALALVIDGELIGAAWLDL